MCSDPLGWKGLARGGGKDGVDIRFTYGGRGCQFGNRDGSDREGVYEDWREDSL